MRWNLKPPCRDGERRVREWFALVPVEIGLEVRWLERVRVRQVFECDPFLMDSGWRNVRFVDDERSV